MAVQLTPLYNSMSVQNYLNVTVTPNTQLYEDTILTMTVPSSINIKNSACKLVSGSMNSYKSCTTDYHSLSLVLDQDISAKSSFTFKLVPLTIEAEGTLAGFELAAKYDGVTLSQTDLNSVKLKIFAQPARIDVNRRRFWPQNTGEPATVEFEVFLGVRLPNSVGTIIIKFPDVYPTEIFPVDVGSYCTSDPPSTSCFLGSDREIWFTGFSRAINSNDKVTLTIFGVGNPAVGDT